MSKRNKKTKKIINKKEYIFNIISILLLLTICVYFGYRSIYYYSKQNNSKNSETLVDNIINNNKITNDKDGFHKIENGYMFKGNIENNYVIYSNRVFRIMSIDKDNNIKLIANNKSAIFFWGEDSSYDNSNVYNWLNKTDINNSGVYFDTLGNNELIKYTSYKENILENDNIKTTKKTYRDLVTIPTIDDYINANGKNSYLNNGEYFWLIGKDDNNSNLFIDQDGNLSPGENYDSYGIRAVITLSKKTKITGGDGTKDNPYVIDMQNKTNYVDQYVKLGNDIWKIYSDKNGVLKLSLNDYIKENEQEILLSYSEDSSIYNLNDKKSLAYYLNNTYLNNLSYKDIILDTDYLIGEISNDTGFSIDNINTNTIKAKVGLLNIFDYNTNNNVTNYYYLNTTSSVGSMLYVNNSLGLLDEEKSNEVKHIIPTISILKENIKNGLGTIDNPYIVE